MANKRRTVHIHRSNPRRAFLKRAAAASVLGSGMGAMNGKLGLMGSALAATGDYANLTDYKALVCVFLYGGSDSFNMFVPTEQGAYEAYANSRNTLALSLDSLLRPNSPSEFGFNPGMTRTKALYDQGRMAVVSNVGNLIRPVGRDQFIVESSAIPLDLFAHNHQQEQWQKGLSSLPSSLVSSGWGGRMADLLGEANGNSPLPPTFSMTGTNHWLPGNVSTPIGMNTRNGLDSIAFMNGNTQASSIRGNVLSQILNMRQAGPLQTQAALSTNRSISSATEIINALGTRDTLRTPYDAGSNLGRQLRMTARMIAEQASLGQQRQIFFVGLGGWDTHDNQNPRLRGLVSELDQSLADFYATLEELQQENQVTTFTASDFGRTLSVNRDGSDHGWGGHYMVMGGAVNGGQLYGELPSYLTGTDDDAGDQGRVIPSLSINQFGASMGSWMGLSDSDLFDVFPDLRNFGSDWRSSLNLFG